MHDLISRIPEHFKLKDGSHRAEHPPGPEPRFAQLRALWSFVQPHRGKLLWGLLLVLFGSALELANPMVVKLVLDTLSAGGGLAAPITLLLGLFAVGAVLGMYHWILLGTVAEKIVLDARTSLVRRYFRAALIPLSRRPSGELVTRATSDTVLLREAASSSVISLINGAVLLVGTLVMMAVLDLALVIVTAAAVLIVTVLFLSLMPALAERQEKAQNSLGSMGGVLDGALRAIRTVKAVRAEERLGDTVLAHARESAEHGVRAVRREAAAWTIAFSGIQLAIIAILGLGALRVASGDIGVSTLIAFLLYAFTLLSPVMELSQSVSTLQSGIAAAKRIRDVQAIPLEPAAEPPAFSPSPSPDGRPVSAVPDASAPLLELRGVTARYAPGAAPALREVDLDIPRRGHTAIWSRRRTSPRAGFGSLPRPTEAGSAGSRSGSPGRCGYTGRPVTPPVFLRCALLRRAAR